MASKKEESKYKTYYMTEENIKRIDEQAEDTGLKKTTIVNKALNQYFENKKK